ncbi:peptide ABC transporter ATP-binding protein, partial [Aggregatibacter sp.]
TALRVKQHEFYCHFPINLREKKIKETEVPQPLTLSNDTQE